MPAAGVFVAYPSLRTLAIVLVSLAVAWLMVSFVDGGVETYRRRRAVYAVAGLKKG